MLGKAACAAGGCVAADAGVEERHAAVREARCQVQFYIGEYWYCSVMLSPRKTMQSPLRKKKSLASSATASGADTKKRMNRLRDNGMRGMGRFSIRVDPIPL